MVRDVEIHIDSDGNLAAVWEDGFGLGAVGKLKVTRLADVDFDNDQQGWVVAFRNGITLPGVFPERTDALLAETDYVASNLVQFAEWARSQEESDG